MSLAVKPVYSGSIFVASPYVPDSNGKLRPSRPMSCPEPASLCGNIQILKWRPRKCGPGYAFAVFRCYTHGRVFTAYPLDWTPYARKSFTDLTPDGIDKVHDDEVRLGWAGTVFQAVIDAADGRRWPDESGGLGNIDERGLTPGGVFRTQCRHICGALSIFAIDENSNRRAMEKVTAYFGIGVPRLMDLSNIREGPWWKAAGEAGARVLDHLGAPGRRHLENLVGLGVDRKYWGPWSPPILSREIAKDS